MIRPSMKFMEFVSTVSGVVFVPLKTFCAYSVISRKQAAIYIALLRKRGIEFETLEDSYRCLNMARLYQYYNELVDKATLGLRYEPIK